MAKQIEFQIVDHGCDGEQYFPGCGVSFTHWTDVVTGIGNSAREAGEDAFEQLAMTLPITTELPVAALADAVRELSDTLTVTEDDSDEWHHYVSIRWRVTEGK